MCITCWRVLIGACDTLLLIWRVPISSCTRLQMLFCVNKNGQHMDPPPPPRSDEYYLVGDIIIGVSLSESHLVRSMAGSTMFVYIYIYMYICRSTFRRHIFDVCPLQFCTQWSAYRLTVRKWLPLANRCIFPAEGFNFLQFPLDPCQSQTHTTPSLC